MLIHGSETGRLTLDAECCIVGAGPAGLALAFGLGSAGHEVVVLESGGLAADPAVQALNEGIVVGAPYAGLAATRHRQVGGTARLWNTPVSGEPGAKYVPLDPHDFADWPFDADTLAPWYERAQALCGLGRFCYDGASWSSADRPCPENEASPFCTGVYQFGSLRGFVGRLITRLDEIQGVRFYPGVTVTEMVPADDGRRVRAVTAVDRDGSILRVTARVVILAAGAVENARLLLSHRDALGAMDAGDWLGRCFMEHPRDFSLRLELCDPDDLGWLRFYDQHQAADGTVIAGRLVVAGDVLPAGGLPRAAITLLPVPRPSRSLVYRILRRRDAPPGSGSYGWSEKEGPCDACRLVLNLEQMPDRENRLVLDRTVDRMGVARPKLLWTWSHESQLGLDRLRRQLAEWFADTGRGRIRYREGTPPDLNAHHHAGTTRMHADPEGGVVDPDLAVHGVDNLFVAGGSVFPRAGWANPTLTIVALSLRLAHNLAGRV